MRAGLFSNRALRVRLAFLAVLVLTLGFVGRAARRALYRDPKRQNFYNALLPTSVAHYLADGMGMSTVTIPILPSLFSAPWPGMWEIPELSAPVYDDDGALVSPALLMLHVMSTPSAAGAQRRAFLRSLSPLKNVPPEYRHLIDFRFVLGYPEDGDKWTHRDELDREQSDHGDLFFLHGLVAGENMNHGKTIAWMEAVAAGPRRAQWVVKTDEDTLVLLPNLLDWLVTQDPDNPTYFGASLTRWRGYLYYFEGMMYGFSWGILKTVEAANIPRDWANRIWDEDARSGELMYSLPTMPGVNPATLPNDHTGCRLNMQTDPPQMEDVNQLRIPRNPDPRTGLYRLDLNRRVANWDKWWVSGPRSAIAYHWLKGTDEYKGTWEKVQSAWRWRAFMWRPPAEMEYLADPNPPEAG